MSIDLPIWVDTIVAALMIASGVLSLIAALGIVRLPDFFQRLHAPALANTLGAWCACGASVVFLSMAEARLLLYPLLLNVLLAITAPITTTLLARAALFRTRRQDDPASSAREDEP